MQFPLDNFVVNREIDDKWRLIDVAKKVKKWLDPDPEFAGF
jgi:hypothetical protein